MKPDLKASMKKVFLLQCATVFLAWSLFGMEYTKPVTIDSQKLPFMWLVSVFFNTIPFVIVMPSSMLLLIGVIFNPLIEESVYRGPFCLAAKRGWLERLDGEGNFLFKMCFWFFAAVVSFRFFGFWHTNYSFAWKLATGFIGLTMVWLVVKCRKLWPAIALHYVWNIMLAGIEFYFSPYIREELIKIIVPR